MLRLLAGSKLLKFSLVHCLLYYLLYEEHIRILKLGMAIRRIFGPHSHSDSLSESDKKIGLIREFAFRILAIFLKFFFINKRKGI